MNTSRLIAAALSLTLFTSCKSSPKAEHKPKAATDGSSANLTWNEAKERKARVDNVRYQLLLKQNEKDETYSGVNKISFDLKDAARSLRLDFYEGKLTALKVNGSDVDLSAKKTYWIDLPADKLKVGANTVEVQYAGKYTRQGLGLHRFVDPETKEVFTYTKFEPYDANRVFPCFDQPDLRATWELQAEVPARWQVISTTKEEKTEILPGERRLWKFPVTPKIATYLFSVHAGPYKVWSDRFDDIPLRIFARPSMAKYVRHQEWFSWTKKGLAFYGKYFDYKYPYKKYDQIFVPEAPGAMENVASVTFTEGLLPRSKPTREQARTNASILLHEMAHMWFGDIVTMAWWNDLWLNESFATYMAALSQAEVTEFKESWQNFFTRQKDWAYWEDGLVTTHPIEAPVNDVKDGLANFDGITYGKGASVIKQLRAYMGAQDFDKGIQHYIKTNEFKNTQLSDFISALQTQTKRDLNAWADAWLRQSGTDKMQAHWACDKGKLTKIGIEMTPSAGARFRPQRFDVGLIQEKKGTLAKPVSVPVDLTQTTQEITGSWPCPDFVYPNLGDHGYLQVTLDPKSLAFAMKNVSRLADPLMRNLLWHDLWEMVRAGEMPLKDYIAVVDSQFSKEQDEVVLAKIVETVSTTLYYWPQATPENKKSREDFIGRMETEYLRRLHASQPGSDPQKFWFDNYSSLARTESGLEQVKKWLDGTQKIPGLVLDIDRRWVLARQLARFQTSVAVPYIEALKKEDSSDRGRRNLLASEAVQPNLEIKQKWYGNLAQSKPALSLAEARAVMNNLFPQEQAELSKQFDNSFFSFMHANAKTENGDYLSQFARRMSPLSCDPLRAQHFRDFLGRESFTRDVSKPLRVGLQEDERCQLVRSKSQMQ